MWLVWIAAFSKYGDVEKVKSPDSINIIRKLTEVFSLFGNPTQIVSKNGTLFTAHVFGAFSNFNGIRHIRVAPYHPSTNGEAESLVQVFKRALRPQIGNKIDIPAEILKFLHRYRTIPDSNTGRSPSEILFGRIIQTTMDLLKPQIKI